MTSNITTDRAGRVEGVVQAVIMAGIGVMAGAASFTHMHDWTMHNAPTGTGDWFGWANAVASELTPTVAVLDIRRRRRVGKRITYPVVVLVCSVALSLSAQFACARASVSGWLLAAVPAVAFLALTKMVLAGGGAGHADHAGAADRADLEADSADRQGHEDHEQHAGPSVVPGEPLVGQHVEDADQTDQRQRREQRGLPPVSGLVGHAPGQPSPHASGVAEIGNTPTGARRDVVRPVAVNGAVVMPR